MAKHARCTQAGPPGCNTLPCRTCPTRASSCRSLTVPRSCSRQARRLMMRSASRQACRRRCGRSSPGQGASAERCCHGSTRLYPPTAAIATLAASHGLCARQCASYICRSPVSRVPLKRAALHLLAASPPDPSSPTSRRQHCSFTPSLHAWTLSAPRPFF